MDNIRYIKSKNLPGIESFFFIRASGLERDPLPGYDLLASSLVVRNIPLASGANRTAERWYQATVSKHTLQYTGSSQQTKSGRQYEHTLTGIIPRISPEQAATLQELGDQRYVLVYQDRNGYLRMIGSREYGLLLSCEESSGQVPGDLNQLSFKFSGLSKFPGYFYSGSLYDHLAAGGGVDFGDVTVTDTARAIADGMTIRIIE